jgi:hypothetical protein
MLKTLFGRPRIGQNVLMPNGSEMGTIQGAATDQADSGRKGESAFVLLGDLGYTWEGGRWVKATSAEAQWRSDCIHLLGLQQDPTRTSNYVLAIRLTRVAFNCSLKDAREKVDQLKDMPTAGEPGLEI